VLGLSRLVAAGLVGDGGGVMVGWLTLSSDNDLVFSLGGRQDREWIWSLLCGGARQL
jgi:hypothetical protein